VQHGDRSLVTGKHGLSRDYLTEGVPALQNVERRPFLHLLQYL
jgi:hypothetical protein